MKYIIKLLKPLAILSLLGFPIAVAIYRFNLSGFSLSFKLISYSLFLALGIFFLSMVASFVLRKESEKSHSARIAALIAIVPIIGLGSQAITANSLPRIHNISTDTVNPAKFDKVVLLRDKSNNPHEYLGDTVLNEETKQTLADLQNAAYPEIKTHISSLSPAEAHAKAKSVAEELGWELVNSDSEAGIIEATETTLIWGFKDDVVIRIALNDAGKTAIDLHSVSRIGVSDIGANAKRITAFLEKFKS